MTFREQATADLPTFLNVDEFSDSVSIDGDQVACILDSLDVPSNSDGIIEQQFTLYMRASDFYKLPVVGQRLTIDDRQADVIGVDEQQGILVLRLRWWDS